MDHSALGDPHSPTFNLARSQPRNGLLLRDHVYLHHGGPRLVNTASTIRIGPRLAMGYRIWTLLLEIGLCLGPETEEPREHVVLMSCL